MTFPFPSTFSVFTGCSESLITWHGFLVQDCSIKNIRRMRWPHENKTKGKEVDSSCPKEFPCLWLHNRNSEVLAMGLASSTAYLQPRSQLFPCLNHVTMEWIASETQTAAQVTNGACTQDCESESRRQEKPGRSDAEADEEMIHLKAVLHWDASPDYRKFCPNVLF